MFMRKLKLLFAVCALLFGVSSMHAKTDVTTTYLKDADLSSLAGWGNPGKTDWKTDGAVNVVEFWNWSNQFAFEQEVTLPAGYYRLAVNAFYRNSWSGDGTNNDMAWIFAGDDFKKNVIALNSMSDLSGYAGSSDLYRAATAFSQGKFSNEFDFDLAAETTLKIGFKGTCPDGGWCILGPVTLWEYTVEDYIDDYNVKYEIAEELVSSPMNAVVLAELQTAMVDKATLTTVDAVKAAVLALGEKINAANTSIAKYAEAKAILDAANGYDATGKESYVSDETIAAIQSAYDARTLTEVSSEQKTAANAALAVACKAQIQPADGCNMTPWIVNPGIDGNVNGWTTVKKGNTGGTGGPLKPSNDAMEYWAGSTLKEGDSEKGFDYYQTITNLPSGAYTISADMLNSTNGEEGASWNDGGKAGLYGKTASAEVQKLVTTDGETFLPYTTDEILVPDGELRIGVKNIAALTGRWFAVDNFKLTYVRQLTAEEQESIAKANAIAAYEEALAAAKAIAEGTIPVSAFTVLTGVITENTLTDGTLTEYTDATAALNTATETAKSLQAPYAAWKAMKGSADALVAVSNNNAAANSTLSSAITTQNTAAEGATTVDALTTATSTMKTAMVTYVTTAEPTNDEFFDLTFMITNSHFTEGNGGTAIPTGWTLENGSITEHRLLTHNFEAYHKTFNLSQTITGLSKGTYKVTLQGFARHDGTDKDKTNLYCGIVNQPIKDIKDEYSTTSITSGKPNMGDGNGESSYEIGDETVYQPNGMSGSYYFFQETNPATKQLFYTNEVQTLMAEAGDLKIGFKCETTTDWVIWDNFHLYYYGSAIAVTIDENENSSSYVVDIDNANITFKRSFKAGKWNTIALPFDLSDAETKAAFGNDVKVATYSETADGANSTVSFKTAADAAIAANTPVLLNTSTDKTSFTFNGKTIKAGVAKVVGTNYDFVGTYAATTTVAEGDYFIQDNKLWKRNSTKEITIKGTRAYIKAKEVGANIANFYIDGIEATAIEALGIAGAKNNGKIYNLNGQEVKSAQKGIYIMNGKKVIK